ncbi:MAG: branched-chain amino acid ABC transporter permease [Sulfurifustis sp.]
MLQYMIDGLALGSTYALLAIGFTLVFGVLRRVNLAYGASIMLGLYLALWLQQRGAFAVMLLAPVVVFITVVAGGYVERICFAPHTGRPAVTSMAASFAVWMQLQEIATLLLPRHSYAFPSQFNMLGGTEYVFVRPAQLVALGCAGVVAAGLRWFLYRTRFGLAVRALTENREAAACVGMNVSRISAAIFALASALGGIAGYLIVSIDGQITSMFAMWATLKGMVAALLGGLGSLPGAVAGGLVLGLIEALLQGLLGPQYRDLGGYGALFLLLWLYTGGLSALWRSASPRSTAEVR